jgi:hypothetical protein
MKNERPQAPVQDADSRNPITPVLIAAPAIFGERIPVEISGRMQADSVLAPIGGVLSGIGLEASARNMRIM